MAARLSLAQQLAQLYDTAPIDYDPENLHPHPLQPPEDPTQVLTPPDLSAGRDHYLDVGPSDIRKLQHSVTDPKYDGVPVSRKQLLDMEDDSQSDDDDHSVTHSNHENVSLSQNQNNIGKEQHSNPPPIEKAEDLTNTLKKTREEDRKKGKAISRQLAIYDSLLDARIRLQKCVSAANRLPHPNIIPSYLVSHEGRAASDKLLSAAMQLSDELFDLHEKLITSNQLTDITLPARKRRRVSEDNNGEQDWEDRITEATQHASSLESAHHPHLITTLLKWSNKVLAVAPSALLATSSANNKFSRNAGGEVKSAVRLIDEALMDRERILTRTKVWRGKGERIGKTNGQLDNVHDDDDDDDTQNSSPQNKIEEDNEDIYDDTDFYQQLLRDVIDSRSGYHDGNGDDETANADWRESQKLKKSHKKKKVDTKASKGRKLRYETHEKLVNFMVPVDALVGVAGVNAGRLAATWHEEQIDELFASLLGRGLGLGLGLNVDKEDRADDDEVMNMDADNSNPINNPEVVAAALSGGFRVFG